MSTISTQYTPALYPLYQAGQGSSGAGQNGSQGNFQVNGVSSLTSNNATNSVAGEQASSAAAAPNALSVLQANQGEGTDSTGSASQVPVATTYIASNTDTSDVDNPDTSFINNQQASADYQSMVLNLGQGNLAAAAKDYAQLQTDLKLHGQHHSSSTVSASTTADAAGSVFSVTV
jgi:hypothetical protein